MSKLIKFEKLYSSSSEAHDDNVWLNPDYIVSVYRLYKNSYGNKVNAVIITTANDKQYELKTNKFIKELMSE